MAGLKKQIVKIVSLLGATCFILSSCAESVKMSQGSMQQAGNNALSYATKTNASIKTNQENFYNSDVIYKVPESVSENQDISVIVTMNTESLVDIYKNTVTSKTLSDFVNSSEARKIAKETHQAQEELIKKLSKSGISYVLGERYDTVLNGFEITIKAKDFESVNKLFVGDASLIIGEVYEAAETEVITNEVDVYQTGIFDSSASKYQGDGVVVAVLDTGLDYTHPAFDEKNFTTTKEAFTLQTVAQDIGDTAAAQSTLGLTAEDVYISKKVPYAYDYADKDPDVLPINSEHGTHVAGIIAGKADNYKDKGVVVNEPFIGVAPNAQLAIMKVFSDTQEGAKSSWLLAALEDCVTLGVDVINMSLGSGCGFAREVDEERVNEVYDSIREAGISLIASAANSYNATMGSEKNGSLGLTSNPDSGTVGSPSTYAAALSVASVDGVKTPYLLYEGDIIYFNEASTSDAKQRDFVDDILNSLGTNVQSHDFEYVTIPGIGRSSDYPEAKEFYAGKIVLVKRGTTTFEDKVRVALKEKGAAGIIIYNNVSGAISMSVGDNVGPVCSIAQDEGEKLAAAGSGIITVSRENTGGPFMSDFSSWGPTSDLQIKPEITAHGGEILSAVPGNDYDRLSGTSMAAPNQAGAAALIRQYVKYSGVFGAETSLTPKQVTDIVNQLMMSTADIIYNKNGLPYAVRKQGAGLVNITKASTAEAYLTTLDKDGNLMEKSKLELGDDKEKAGVYEMTFMINNITNQATTYNIASMVITEGVSETYTSHSETTVTQDGYLLSGTQTLVTAVTNGTKNGNTVTVGAGQTATVSVKLVLAETDKKYMDDSFEYGMYVEGFITLDAVNGATTDLNVPLLAFYGDWTEAPIFDEEYYDTNTDEINQGIDPEDKLMADAYATRVIGGLYTDYIATLGTYYFTQDPAATQIAASKEHIAISNQESTTNATINSIRSISAGLLRNAKEVNISIIEDSTGKEIFNRTEYNLRKSFNSGGSIRPASIDVEFSTLEHKLKNNTRYTVTVTSYIDYGTKEDQKNVRNTFEFPLYIDFEAPIITDVTYRTEYDRTTKKTKLFADLYVYDNHYAMGMQLGQIVRSENPEYTFAMETFGKYVTPIYSSFNSTSKVSIELTDYVSKLKESVGINMATDGNDVIENNSFIAVCYDYAMNSGTYEIRLPDEVIAMYFTEEELRISPNETKDLTSLLSIYPADTWLQVLDFESDSPAVADVVNQTIIAKKSGEAWITATGYNKSGEKITAKVKVTVLAEGDEGYKKYDVPAVNKFEITGYKVNKAYYNVSSEEREIGLTDGSYDFGASNTLSMFPSESVTLRYTLDSNFPEQTKITYQVGNSRIATVDENGTIVAQQEGTTIVTVNVLFNGQSTLYSGRVSITVKDPFTTMSMYLMNYRGLGGVVEIPSDRGITTIYSYAFSGYEYVDKDLSAGDVIDKEDPYYIKQMYIGDDTIEKIIIPEGVTTIEAYAFANLTALKEVELPKSLVRIGVGAFLGCENLRTINLEYAKFINEKAFSGCALETIELDSVVAIGNYTFEDCRLNHVELPKSSQSLGIGAFYNNKQLLSVTFEAPKIKIGEYAFAGCSQLKKIDINAAVIASYAFYDCTQLIDVILGKDVSIVGEYAFGNTNVAKFVVKENGILSTDNTGVFLYKDNELILVAPAYAGTANVINFDKIEGLKAITSIATGAFAGNTKIFRVYANNVTNVGAYAFAGCTNLKEVRMDNVQIIGDYAFTDTDIQMTPDLKNATDIGAYAFANTEITEVALADDVKVANYAFAYNVKLESVTIGNNATIGEAAFYCPIQFFTYEETENFQYYTAYTYEVKDENGEVVKTYSYYRYNFNTGVYSRLKNVTIGTGAKLGNYAFADNAKLENLTLGTGTEIGDYAFYNTAALNAVDFSGVTSIGKYAFSGSIMQDYCLENNVWQYAYTREYVDGKEVLTGYVYTKVASTFATANITSVKYIGEGAFAGNTALSTVIFSDEITEISAYTFANCEALAYVELPEQITFVGDYAFYNTQLNNAEIVNVSDIGNYAFAGTKINIATLKAGVNIGEGAFAYCEQLAAVENLDKAQTIGANAFNGTALMEVSLTEAVSIGDFAFANSNVTKVTLGNKLVELGENPFYACAIETFGKVVDATFGKDNATVGSTLVENYDVSATVKVIDGVLYQTVPTGWELISYPMAKVGDTYVVEEGTSRITARAFAGSALESVTLPSTLKALGDKAFYECENLSVVVFKSFEAPMLEEEYDASYLSYSNLPYTGKLGEYEGLGISKFYMWNVTSSFNNFYFGANFVDHIGYVDNDLVMVKPANGLNYNTFIFSQYFGTTVEGSNAASDATVKVIAMINALPDNTLITLANENAVVAARAAFEQLPSLEQRALVVNLSKLESAEDMIIYLKGEIDDGDSSIGGDSSNGSSSDISSDETQTPAKKGGNAPYVIAIVIVAVLACGLAVYIGVDKFVLPKKKKQGNEMLEEASVEENTNEE